jgi:RNA polymerase sigma-70 factor (ECF subfamily)
MLLRRKLAARARHFPAAPEGAADALPDHHVGPADLAMSREEAERCRRWLEQLPESQREVIRLRIYEGKRFREIAASLGCPLNTALARMHQGLKRLRSLEEMNHAG